MFLHLIWDTGRTILVVYDEIDEDTLYPVTAYDLED